MNQKIQELYPNITFGRNNPSYYQLEEIKKRNYYEEEISYEQKLEFSNLIKKLKEDEIAQIVKILKNQCPRAYKVLEGDQSEILVDNITQEVYEVIKSYAKTIVGDKRVKN